MEPQLPTPNLSPERGPAQSRDFSPELRFPAGQENLNKQPGNLEIGKSPEQQTGAGAGENQAFSQATAQAAPVPPPPLIDNNSTIGVNDDTPLVASDEDLIEMEWVNKAKKIINDTKSDPYLQEREVSKLQASYLQKRYSKEVKLAKDE